MQQRMVQKFSVVYLSTGDRVEVYRSLEEMPEELRQRLNRRARESQIETLVIANERGRKMLEEQGLGKPQKPAARPVLSPPLKWAVGALLAGLVGIALTIAWNFR